MDDTLYEKLINASFRFVSFRPRSEKEIKDFLQKKMHKWKVAGRRSLAVVLERLRQLGYLDDYKFALWWIEQRRKFKPKGRRQLKLELRQKGVNPQVIEEILQSEGATGFGDSHMRALSPEIIDAQNAIQKKIAIWKKLPLMIRKKKVYDFLARRGFSTRTIFHVIDELGQKDYNTDK